MLQKLIWLPAELYCYKTCTKVSCFKADLREDLKYHVERVPGIGDWDNYLSLK